MEINLFPKFLDEATTPIARSVGNTIASLWSIAFGGIDIYAEKKQYERTQALNQFKEELEQKVLSIPVENLVEPPLHIIGPTIEASKYYFENENLRSMFSNLIASSINIQSISKTHPSFVEVIKQLSPLDAKNLQLFKGGYIMFPMANYKLLVKNSNSFNLAKRNVFLGNNNFQDIELNSTSIVNLDRLGLLEITYNNWINDDYTYEPFKQLDFFKIYNAYFELDIIDDNTYSPDLAKYQSIEIQKGMVTPTPFGVDFIEICVSRY